MRFVRVVLALAAAARAASAAVDVAAADACVATCGGGGVDSETWYRKKAKKDCGWVGRDAAKVAKRCKKSGVDAALAPPCSDDASWVKDDGNGDKGCDWISDQVARGDPGRQCARARDARGARAEDACACACAAEPPATYAYEIYGATIVDAGAARRRLGGGGGRRDAVDDYVAAFNGDDAAGPAFCGAVARVVGAAAESVDGCAAGRGPAAGVAAITYVVTVVEPGRWGDTDAFALAALASVRNVLGAAAADGSLAGAIADALSFFGDGAPVRVPETVAAWAALGGGDVRCDGGTPAPTSPTPAPTASAVESGEGAGECDADADCFLADCFSYHGSSSAPPYYVAPCADFADGGTCAAAAPGTAGRCRGDYIRSEDRAIWNDVAGTCAFTAGAVACAAGAAGTAAAAEAFEAAPSYVAQGAAWEAVDRGPGGGSVYVGLAGAGGGGDGKAPYTFGIRINGHSTSVTEGGDTVYVQNPPLPIADGDEFAVLVSANEVSYYFRGAKVYTSAGTADWSDPAGYRVVVDADATGAATGAAVRNVRVLVAQDEPASPA